MRNLLVLGGLVIALLHPCGAFAQPDPRADSKAAKTPSGVRVGYTLILFGCEDAVVKSMGIEGQKTLNGPYLGTWHDIKGAKAMDKKRMEPLERGDFDMLLLATPHCFPNAETWANQLGFDSTPALLCDKGVMKNPKFRLVWQTWFWPTYEGKEEKKLKVPAATQPYRAEEHRALEKLADEVNKKHGRQVLVISPVAEATNELIKMVAAGKFPGLKDPSLLWKDADMWQSAIRCPFARRSRGGSRSSGRRVRRRLVDSRCSRCSGRQERILEALAPGNGLARRLQRSSPARTGLQLFSLGGTGGWSTSAKRPQFSWMGKPSMPPGIFHVQQLKSCGPDRT